MPRRRGRSRPGGAPGTGRHLCFGRGCRHSGCHAAARFGAPPQAVDSDKVRAGRLDPRQLEFPVQTVYGATLDFVAKEDIREHPQACGLFRVTVNTRADAPTVTCRGDRDLYRAARRIGAGDADLNLGCGYDGGAGRVGGHDRREAELPERGPLRGRAKA